MGGVSCNVSHATSMSRRQKLPKKQPETPYPSTPTHIVLPGAHLSHMLAHTRAFRPTWQPQSAVGMWQNFLSIYYYLFWSEKEENMAVVVRNKPLEIG